MGNLPDHQDRCGKPLLHCSVWSSAGNDPMDATGPVFTEVGPFFKLHAAFVNNFDEALATLDRCRLDPKVSGWLMAVQQAEGADLQSLLIMPVQRLPRYVMLLQQLVKYSPEAHTDFAGLVTSLEHLDLLIRSF